MIGGIGVLGAFPQGLSHLDAYQIYANQAGYQNQLFQQKLKEYDREPNKKLLLLEK